jgi:N-dimethylarginine dimethylaminohydrolase
VSATTRRGFMKTVVAATASAGVPALASASALQAGAGHVSAESCGLSVTYEWGALKEAIVGCARMRIPTGLYDFYSNYMPSVSIASGKLMSRLCGGKPLSDAMPKLFWTAVEQMDKAIEILQRHGVVVHQVQPFEEAEESFLRDLAMNGGLQQFARDPILVIGNRMIETAMYAPNRRKEKFAIRRTLAERLVQLRADVFSIPEPLPYPEGENGFAPGAYLEGGDVFVLGKDIYVGVTGNASSPAGIQCLQAILGPEYQVHVVQLSKKFLHLDCVLATPRPGLAIVCREGFVEGLPRFLTGWHLIEVSAVEAETKLATNVLVLDEETTIVATETPSVARALTEAGQRVITTPFSAVFLFGGAFRCWHHPLIRTGGSPPPIL